MPAQSVKSTHEGGVALVSLSNPPLNLVTLAMTRELDALVSRLAADPDVRVMVLTGSGEKKIHVIKVVRELTGLGLKEAKDLVDGAPKAVKEGVTKAEAEEVQKKLVDAGATVELK